MSEHDRTELPLLERFGEDLERAMRRHTRTRRHAPRRAVAIAGVAVLLTGGLLSPPGRAASGWVGQLVGIGDPPTLERPQWDQKVGKSVVFATGRAPDGARYEVVLDEFKEPTKSTPDKASDSCLLLEWPDVPGEGRSGSCGPGFPPAVTDKAAIGRYYSPPAVLPKATKHLVLNGFARSDVSRVRVLYKDDAGPMRDAPVDFVRIRGALRERVGVDKPFGFYVAFLPPSFSGYHPGSPGDAKRDIPACRQSGARDPGAVELIAYDAHGKQIERVKRDNVVAGVTRC